MGCLTEALRRTKVDLWSQDTAIIAREWPVGGHPRLEVCRGLCQRRRYEKRGCKCFEQHLDDRAEGDREVVGERLCYSWRSTMRYICFPVCWVLCMAMAWLSRSYVGRCICCTILNSLLGVESISKWNFSPRSDVPVVGKKTRFL